MEVGRLNVAAWYGLPPSSAHRSLPQAHRHDLMEGVLRSLSSGRRPLRCQSPYPSLCDASYSSVPNWGRRPPVSPPPSLFPLAPCDIGGNASVIADRRASSLTLTHPRISRTPIPSGFARPPWPCAA